jgi:hypothetical protein
MQMWVWAWLKTRGHCMTEASLPGQYTQHKKSTTTGRYVLVSPDRTQTVLQGLAMTGTTGTESGAGYCLCTALGQEKRTVNNVVESMNRKIAKVFGCLPRILFTRKFVNKPISSKPLESLTCRASKRFRDTFDK